MKFGASARLLLVGIPMFLVCNGAFSQITKEFIGSDGRIAKDSSNAQAILTVEKISDTAYSVHQYNMNHILLAEGVFKDAQLTDSNGEFTYYKVQPASIKLSYHYDTQKIDTITTPEKLYVASRGNLFNGSKYGIWTDYYSNGSPQYINSLRADTTNGMSKIFYQLPDFLMQFKNNPGLNSAAHKMNNLASIQGNYVNGKRNGPWYSISGKGDTIAVDYYQNDKGVKSIDYLSDKRFQTHIKPGYPDYDIDVFLNRKLSTRFPGPDQGSLKIRFTLSKDGKLKDPLVENLNNDLELNKFVIAGLLSFSDWKPAYVDNKAVKSEIEVSINYSKKANGSYQFTFDQNIGYRVPDYNGY